MDAEAISTMDYIERHADRISIRCAVNGKVDNYRLVDLPADIALHWAFVWLKEGRIPHTVNT